MKAIINIFKVLDKDNNFPNYYFVKTKDLLSDREISIAIHKDDLEILDKELKEFDKKMYKANART